jgi:ribonuclease-3
VARNSPAASVVGRGHTFGGHAFADGDLLAQALSHRSAGSPHNERLEFLGDALLNLIIAEQLYARWPKADEGAMTRARAELVRESALAGVARMLELGARLTLGPGEIEAIIAALYLDAGFDVCRQVVLPWFEPLLAELPPLHQVGKDAKTRLQEWLQGRQLALPGYAVLEESGDDHDKRFRVGCTVIDPPVAGEGSGTSRRAAEQAAAEAALIQLKGPTSGAPEAA